VDSVIIFPEPGNLKPIAKKLLELAEKRTDVEYVMWPEPGFRVPEELAERFTKIWKNADEPVEVGTSTVVEGPVPAEPEVVEVKRRPGRPKKNQEGQ
jgi:hypothetical protein